MAYRSSGINIYTIIFVFLSIYIIYKSFAPQKSYYQRNDYSKVENNFYGSKCAPRDVYAPIPEYIYDVIKNIVENDQFVMPSCSYRRQDNFVYLQVKSCASQTLANIFGKYALEHNLTVVLPVKYKQYLGWPHNVHYFMYRPAARGKFNVMVDKAIYNRSIMAGIMPEDTVYFTMIREPFDRLKRALFDGGMKGCGHMPKDTIDETNEFLKDMETYDRVYKAPSNILNISACPCVKKGVSIAKNAMAFDLGFQTGFHMRTKDMSQNYTFIEQWLKDINSQLNFILIQERFSESLIFLKRYMCWGFKELLFAPITYLPGSHSTEYSSHLIQKFIYWSNVDTVLYEMARRTFDKRIQSLGQDFMDEVFEFKKQLATFSEFCSQGNIDATLQIPPSKWDRGYELIYEDCRRVYNTRVVTLLLRKEHDEKHGEFDIEHTKWNYNAWC